MGISLLAALLFSSLLSILTVQIGAPKADAQEGPPPVVATWINATTISVTIAGSGESAVRYVDPEPGDGTMEFTAPGACGSIINGFSGGPLGEGTNKSSATFRLGRVQDGVCVRGAIGINIQESQNSQIWFNWVDAGRIEPVFNDFDRGQSNYEDLGGAWVPVEGYEGPGERYGPDVSGCRYITFTTATQTGTGSMRVHAGEGAGCPVDTGRTYDVRIGNLAARSIPAGQGETTGPSGDDEPEEEGDSCESKSAAMGWILCPVINLLDGALNWMDTYVNALLEVDENKYTNENIRGAWASMRNIAYIILVPIMLVMVIGTALSFDFISAYTVKRALPRLVIAVIFIALSWNIMVFLVGFSNAAGSGTLGIITAPFRAQMGAACQDTMTLGCFFEVQSGVNGGSILRSILLLPQAAATVVGLIVFLIFFGDVLLLAVGVAFIVLLTRQMFIIALMIVSPLAILAWIFPGNDKLWKAWWSLFSKLLLMYPLIMLLIGVGRVFAFILNTTDGGSLDGAVLNPIMKLIAYMIPYALIPLTYKFAGGTFALLAGGIGDRSKGFGEKRRKNRAEKAQRWKNRKAIKNAPEGSWRDKINTAAAVGANARKAGYNPTKWRGKMSNVLTTSAVQGREAMLKDEDYVGKFNDSMNMFASQSSSESDLRDRLTQSGMYHARDADGNLVKDAKGKPVMNAAGKANMERDISSIEEMRRRYGTSAFQQATWASALAGGTAFDKEYTDISGNKVKPSAWEGAARIAGDNDQLLNDMVAKKGTAMNAGRADQGAAGHGATLGIANKFRTGVIDKTTGQRVAYTADMARKELTKKVYDQQGGAILVHSSMKATAVEEIAPAMAESVQEGLASGNADQAAQSVAALAAVYEGLNGTSPEKARILATDLRDDNGNVIRKGVLNQTVDVSTLPAAVQQMLAKAPQLQGGNTVMNNQQIIEALRGNEDFQRYRREYQSQIAAVQAGGPPAGPGGAPTALPGQPGKL